MLKSRVCVITGAGSGLGLDMIAGFGARGATVVGLDRQADSALAVSAAAGSAPNSFQTCDVTDPGAVQTAMAHVVDQWGHIDVLVNSAGIRDVSPALSLSIEQWRTVLDVDVTGTFLCSQAAGAYMVPRGRGSIIFVSSVAGLVGVAERVAYTTSKHAVIGLMKALTAEWGPAGVRINTICPGMTVTPLTEAYATEDGMLESVRRVVPAGRVGQPEDITNAAAFLASDESTYLNGIVIPVDGGFTAVRQYDVLGRSQNWSNQT